jgi:alkaline phosphatase
MKIKLLLAIISISLLITCSSKTETKIPKNIIFLIGDGMGVSQVYAALTAKKDNLNIAQCKHIGFIKTSAADNYITDSAASGTAYATGKKTKNGYVGVDSQGKKLPTILEIAEKNNIATGLVATSAMTPATPASFIAHNPDRGKYEEIAMDFLKTDIDIFVGGGRKYFEEREDSLNLIDSLRARDYSIISDLNELKYSNSKKIAALIYNEHPPKFSEGRANMLEMASKKAIEVLSQNEKGFFLMIESSQIDWGGHDKDSKYVVEETVDFDNVVGQILDFAKKDGETLVVITADHECGGYAITGGDISTGKVEGKFCTDGHTATMVPVFAYGPGAENFMGIFDNTEIFHKFKKIFGI